MKEGERLEDGKEQENKNCAGPDGAFRGNRGVFRQVTEEMAKAAAGAKAELLCLPELSSCGYFIRREELLQAAVPAEAEASRIEETARKYGISIISGYPERDGDRIYNSCVAVKNTGELIGNVRKVNLWKSEKKRFSEGNDFPVLDTCTGKAAVILCYDLEFPEPARIVSMKGLNFYSARRPGAGRQSSVGKRILRQQLSRTWCLWQDPITVMNFAAETLLSTGRTEGAGLRSGRFF